MAAAGSCVTEGRSGPWVTLGSLLLMLAATWLCDFGQDVEVLYRFGSVPSELSIQGLLGYPFFQSGWLQLGANLALVLLLAPTLEQRFGHTAFAGFMVLAAVASGLAHALFARGAVEPLVGANGQVAALLGALVVRFGAAPVQITAGLNSLGLVARAPAVPAWVMVPVWAFAQLLLAAFGETSGVSGVADPVVVAAGCAFGAAVAAALRWGDIEGRWINARGETARNSGAASLAERVLALRTTGRVAAAFELLESELRQGRPELEAVTAFIEVAGECGRGGDACAPLLAWIDRCLRRDEAGLAVEGWCEVSERRPDVLPDRRLALRLAPLLDERGHRALAIGTLRTVFDPRAGRLRAGTALQLMEVATPLDPPTALAAVRHVLADPDFPPEKRERLETLADELAARAASLPGFEADTQTRVGSTSGPAHAIDVELDPMFAVERLDAPTREPSSWQVRELDATGSLVSSPSSDDLLPAALAVDVAGLPPAAANALSPPASDDVPTAPVLPSSMPLPASPSRSLDDSAAAVELVAAASAALVPRCFGVKVIEACPESVDDAGLVLVRDSGRRGTLAWSRIHAIAVAVVSGLSDKPVLLIDLVLNWNDADAEQLQLIRLRSDRFDVRRLSPASGSRVDAFRAVLEQIFARTDAVPLPDRASVRGRPFTRCPDLASYQRSLLQVDE